MTVPVDPFSFTNGTTADATQVNSRFALLYAALNGALDVDNVLPAVKQKVGLSDATTVRRGKSIIPTTEGRTNTAYGLMPSPDRVQNLVLPVDGLIFVAYQAAWAESVLDAARAAIFIGANQLKLASTAGAPVVQEARTNAQATLAFAPLATGTSGLSSPVPSSGATEVSTGQLVASTSFSGGASVIYAAAGTYDVSVQFKASSGSVTVLNRHLWVWTAAF